MIILSLALDGSSIWPLGVPLMMRLEVLTYLGTLTLSGMLFPLLCRP